MAGSGFCHEYLASAYALTGRLDAAHKELKSTARLFPGLFIAKALASARQISADEIYLKQVDHIIAGSRLAVMPEN